ncbi:hypothetical protein mRhiFer1_009127 [Rhinolophus ferrumequinum]|uniref:KRAB domain-containing protein n=1 Tax=Rhinolophus ferrumequinum TaxID=59479 RepID=A0A7J7SJ89_RHIFE|nr:hypothetical protein mRhiFer1_009127 [Rhinolophus ferrumequinum]
MTEAEGSLSFKDVTVDFTWEEWQLLVPEQKDLYPGCDVGELQPPGVRFPAIKPEALFRLEQEPWRAEEEISSHPHPVTADTTNHIRSVCLQLTIVMYVSVLGSLSLWDSTQDTALYLVAMYP